MLLTMLFIQVNCMCRGMGCSYKHLLPVQSEQELFQLLASSMFCVGIGQSHRRGFSSSVLWDSSVPKTSIKQIVFVGSLKWHFICFFTHRT